MAPMIIGLLIFFGIHALPMQPDLRKGLVERFGAGAFKAAFSVIAFVGLVLIILGYGKLQVLAGKNPQIWVPPTWTSHLTVLLMIPSIILLVAAYVPSNLQRLTKHPMLAAIKIWALAHLIANGDLASIVLFGSFLIYGVVGRISAKRRGLAPAATVGRSAGVGDFISIGVGVALWAVIVAFLHEWLIGVAPLAGGGG